MKHHSTQCLYMLTKQKLADFTLRLQQFCLDMKVSMFVTLLWNNTVIQAQSSFLSELSQLSSHMPCVTLCGFSRSVSSSVIDCHAL